MNEQEEFHLAKESELKNLADVRQNALDVVGSCRSLYMVAVTPDGQIASLCFFQGFVDLRVMQLEAMERLNHIMKTNFNRQTEAGT